MFNTRDNSSRQPESPCVSQHYEPDKLATVIGSDDALPKQKARKLAFDRLNVLTVMPEALSLPHWRLIEDCGHASHEVVVEGRLPYLDTFLFGFTDQVPNARFDLMIPPVLIILDRQYS